MKREEIIKEWNSRTPRERDIWVAEEIFDCRSIGMFDCVYIGVFTDDKGEEFAARIPDFSLDISAAWKITETFPAFDIGSLTTAYGYVCRVWDEHGLIISNAYGSTASEVICLAALIAKLTNKV